ncbi:MAG: alpha/beta hydrolase [Myxococcales bacterium]|nr:alpha/beta hydrolase [Myxococcota bacterium]MDW8280742.1 alpha/beta hydrolase [Myxococcales bacterium]
MRPPLRSGRLFGLAYRWHGPEGEPLLVLAGLLGDSRRLRRLGRDLSTQGPVLLVDPLGGGDSEVPHDPAAYRWDAQVDRLERLLDALGLGAVDVLGLSLGGMWAQQLHLRAPHRLRRAVLAASCVHATPRLRALLSNLRAQVQAGLPPLELARWLIGLLFSPPFLDRPGAVALLESMLLDTEAPPAGLLGQIDAILAHDARGRLGGLRARVIGGALDWLLPPGDQMRLQQEVGGAPIHLLPESGHCLWIEQPAAFAAAVAEALASWPRSQSS